MRILVAGRSGQLAEALRETPGHEIVALGRPDLDLTRSETIAAAFDAARPEAVINAAAYTAVDKAETDEAAAMAVNAGAGRLAAAASRLGLPFIHVSTDYVFDGRASRPYREDDPVAPLGAYGRSKRAGEIAVLEAMPQAVIVRTAWVFHHGGANFLRTMLRLAETRDEVGVVADQRGAPTYAPDLAVALVAMIERMKADGTAAPRGLFHATGSGETTWHGFAAAIFAGAARRGLKVPALKAIATADYPTPARRPAYSVLDCARLEADFGLRLPQWQDAVERCLTRLIGPPHE
ncbi:MAG: dTDP-4-dehydrorhamnose reductase [Alphaproteobacteria bacterium]|nr:dTDP-4-dehydrorhamnose reductase [Alphaproteobacteria bacterium]